MEWQKGEPEKSAYYLVAWRSTSGLVIVSELWFNPDAIYHWWSSRGYFRHSRAGRNPLEYAMKQEVVGWMPMPDLPEEKIGI